MSDYRLDLNMPLEGEVRRVALGELASVLELLHDPERVDDRAVHEARKHAKKLRALLRLIRGALPKAVRRSENTAIRDAARRLAGAREAAVRLATYDDLVSGGRGLAAKEGVADTRVQLLAAHASAAGSRLAEVAPEVRCVFEAVMLEVESWDLSQRGFAVVAAGLEWVYRRGRERFEECALQADAVNMHEWRKRVKDLWYHHRLFVELWPPVMEARCAELKRLSDLLGDAHDLDDLHHRLHLERRGPLDTGQVSFRRRLLRVRRKLRRQALELGRTVYAERPAHFVTRFRELYRSLEGGPSQETRAIGVGPEPPALG